jgi:NitT/TauT family transport system substrate-binding protein
MRIDRGTFLTGMIKSSPQKIISQGTDWRFLNELKKELKA